MPRTLSAPPLHDALVHHPQRKLTATTSWVWWWQDLADRIAQSPEHAALVTSETMSSAIGATAIPLGSLPGALYLVIGSVWIRQPAGTSSSVQLRITWTEETTPYSLSTASLTANVAGARATVTDVIASDSASPILYETTYSSTGTPNMGYQIRITLQRLR